MQLWSRLVCWVLSTAILSFALLLILCRQNESYASPESAGELFAKGLTLYAKEQFSDASVAFEGSYSLAPSQETLFAWAQAERLQGHCDRASELFESYISKGSDVNQTKVAFQFIKECSTRPDNAKQDGVNETPRSTETPDHTETQVVPPKKENPLSNHAAQSDIIGESDSPKQGLQIPLYRRWEVYAGGSLLAAAAGGYFALSAQSLIADAEAVPDGTEFSVAENLVDRAERRALFANISFVGAGAFAATAVWLVLRTPDSTASDNTVSIVPLLAPSEMGFTVHKSF